MNKLRLGRFVLFLLSLIPKKYPIEYRNPDSRQPFFVFNAGRSGSTLFNRLLNQHPDVFLPSEQRFIHNIIIKFRLYNWILWRDLGKVLAGEMVNALKMHTWEFDYQETFREIVLAERNGRSLHAVIDLIVKNYASQLSQNPLIWGDTTPTNSRYYKEIFRAYKNAKYIYLVRDGRDVVASYEEGAGVAPFMHLKNHVEVARNWRSLYDVYTWLKKKTKNILIVKYEDLVDLPEQTVSEVYSFLDVSAHEVDTSDLQIPNISFYKSAFHKNLYKPVNTDSIGRWKDKLDRKELSEILPIIQGPMNRLGYF